MNWKTVAEGSNISELRQMVSDMELTKGTKIRVVMDTSMPWLFDIAGAEWAFKPFIPDGVDLIDVYGEGNQGIVDMEADPIWLVVFLAFVKAHWLAIIIAGFVLTVVISFIRVMVEVAVAPTVFPAIAVIAGVILVALLLMRNYPSRSNPKKLTRRKQW